MRFTLILFLLFLPSVHSEIMMRADVQNEVPGVIGWSANLLFEGPQERFSEEDVVICRNQPELPIDLLIAIEDRNSIEDVLAQGVPSCYLETADTRNGDSPLSLLERNLTVGIFHAHETFLRNGSAITHYTVVVRANDSGGEVESREAGFNVREDDCLADILLNVSNNATYSLGDLGVTLGFSPAVADTAPLYVRTSSKCDVPSERVVVSCLTFRSLPRFESAVLAIEIDLAYPEAGNKEEKKYSLWHWKDDAWALVPGSTTDMKANTVNAQVSTLGTYAIRGREACIEHWVCDPWSLCTPKRFMTRDCEDINGCGTEEDKPETQKTCVYTPRGRLPEAPAEPVPTPGPVIEGSPQDILFDINLDVIGGGVVKKDILLFKVSLINFGDPGSVTVSLEYAIMNGSGILYSRGEKVTLETQTELLREIDVSSLSDGEYSLTANLTYETQTEPAQAHKAFTIDRTVEGISIIWGVLVGIIIAVIICIIMIHHRHKGEPHGPSDRVGLSSKE